MSVAGGATLAKNVKASGKLHCELDDWDFDPRYTDGACPICGWRPAAAVQAEAAWMTRVRELPWDFILLGVLFVVLVVAGFFVGRAAGIKLTPQGY